MSPALVSPNLPLPDDTLVFEVELSNLGVMPSAFQLYTEHKSNPGMLNHIANGDTLTVPQQYDRIDADEKITSLISITRGPVAFDYAPFKLFFRSACEFTLNIGDGNLLALGGEVATAEVDLFNVVDPSFPEGQQERIRFAQPCPAIEWDGDLAAEQKFRVNLSAEGEGSILTIKVRNPQSPRNSFADLVNQPAGRLEEAGLWFREEGSTDWQRAVDESGQVIDFVLLPEQDGAIEADWFVGSLRDGLYEIEARTVCEQSRLIPVDFHSSSTPRLVGVLDRKRPKLFGLPFPESGGLLHSSDLFRFQFSESIRCTEPRVFDVEVAVEPLVGSPVDVQILEERHLLVICEDRSVSVALDPAAVSDLDGRVVTVTLSGVEDLNGNSVNEAIPIVNTATLVVPTKSPTITPSSSPSTMPSYSPAPSSSLAPRTERST